MKKLLTLTLLTAAAAAAQTVYPGALDGRNTLMNAVNQYQTTLTVAMTSTSTSMQVLSATNSYGTAVSPYTLLTFGDTGEIVQVCGVSGTILSIGSISGCPSLTGRGFDGTSTAVAAHAIGTVVSAYIDAYNVNASIGGLIAVETALGPNLSVVNGLISTAIGNINLNPVNATYTPVFASYYNYSAQTCNSSNVCSVGGSSGATLAGTANVITMTPVPVGMNGSDHYHHIYVSGGTGAAEACLITGGTGTSGSTSGQIILTCGNSHSGAFTLRSSSTGIEEALQLLVTGGVGGTVYIGRGTSNVYSTITIPGSYYKIVGVGRVGTYISASTLTTGPLFSLPNGGDQDEISDMDMEGPNDGVTPQFLVDALGASNLTMKSVSANGFGQGISLTDPSSCVSLSTHCTQMDVFRDVLIYGLTGDGALINTTVDGGTWDHVVFASYGGGVGTGWEVKAAVGLRIGWTYCSQLSQCILLDPPSGSTVGVVQLLYVGADGPGTGFGLHLSPASGGTVNSVSMHGGGFYYYQYGIITDGSGVISDINFYNIYNTGNKYTGGYFNYGTGISFTDSWFECNSVSNQAGLVFEGGSNIQIKGGLYGPGSFGAGCNSQTYGIYLQNTSHVKVESLNASGNITGSVIDAGGNTDLTISNVQGYSASGDGPPVAPTCAGSPGNTVAVYHSLCSSSSGIVYACNNSGNCSVAADWVPQGGSGTGTITGVTTASSSGLQGGGMSGTLTMALATCAANQSLYYTGSTWSCTTVYTGSPLMSSSTSDLTLSGTYQAVAGASVTFTQIGHYLITGNVLFSVATLDIGNILYTKIECGSGPTSSNFMAVEPQGSGPWATPVQFIYDSTTGSDSCSLWAYKAGGTGSTFVNHPSTNISAVWVGP